MERLGGQFTALDQAGERSRGFEHAGHSGGVVLGAEFVRVSQGEHLLIVAGSRDDAGHRRILPGVVASLGHGFDAHGDAARQQVAEVGALARSEGEARQGAAGFGESPAVVAPGIHPVVAVEQVGIFRGIAEHAGRAPIPGRGRP